MKTTFQFRRQAPMGMHLLAPAAIALLAACGGGQEAAVEPTLAAMEVPASASVSAAAFTRFAASNGADDAAEPMSLDNLGAAPTSETDEPLSLGAGA